MSKIKNEALIRGILDGRTMQVKWPGQDWHDYEANNAISWLVSPPGGAEFRLRPERRFVVDGSDPDSGPGDGQGYYVTGCTNPPFAVFDIEAQSNVCVGITEIHTAHFIADALEKNLKGTLS